MKLLGNEWILNLLKPKLGMIKKLGRYNLMLDKRFGFIILVERERERERARERKREREEKGPLSYRVVKKAHILLLENSMRWFTVYVGRTEAKIKLFTQID